MTRVLWSTLLVALLGAGVGPVVAQVPAYDHLEAARVQMRHMQLDSAVGHLRLSLDTVGHPTRDDQVQAWLLLGVISFYKGDDSATSDHFRHALALDPLLKADGLARYDSGLVVLFNAQRTGVAADAGPRASGTDVLVDCTKTCPNDVVLPRILDVSLFGLGPDRFEAVHDRWGLFRIHFIVDTAGWVAPASVKLIESTLQMKWYERDLLDALQRSRFMPGRLKGHAIPVLVEGKLIFRSGHLDVDMPVSPRRRAPL